MLCCGRVHARLPVARRPIRAAFPAWVAISDPPGRVRAPSCPAFPPPAPLPPPLRAAPQHIRAQAALFTAGVVLLSLVLYAPLLLPLVTTLKLNKATPAKRLMHRRARAAVAAYTKQALTDLQHDDDEMLRGVDWAQARAPRGLRDL